MSMDLDNETGEYGISVVPRGVIHVWRSRCHKIADVSLNILLAQTCRTYGRGSPIRALLYSLVITLCTCRLGWLELSVMALGGVDLAYGMVLRLITI